MVHYFKGHLIDADGSCNYFETDQAVTDTPTLYITLSPYGVSQWGRLITVRWYMNPTNAVTYDLYLFDGAYADDLESNMHLIFDSNDTIANCADSVTYQQTNMNRVFRLTWVNANITTKSRMYYLIDWSGAPGDTSGFISVEGERESMDESD